MKKVLLITLILVLVATSFYLVIILKEKRVVTIIYTSDLQGVITPVEDSEYKKEPRPLLGGSAYLATYLKKERISAEKKNRGFIFVDTGNFFSGKAEGYFFKGSSVIEIMNKLSYDAMAIGGKDFAFGEENLRKLAEEAKFPFLGANIVREDNGEIADYATQYIIKEIKGIKIGIIGITSPLIFSENIIGLKILDPILTTRKYVSTLRNKGTDLIVVLSNLGLEEDKKLAREVKGINIIIGGNDPEGYRVLVPFYVDPKNKTIIVETSCNGGSVDKLDCVFDKKRMVSKYRPEWKDILVANTKPDPEIQAIVQKYIDAVEEKKKETIGYAQTSLMRSKDKESSLGNWIADVLRQKTKSDIALVGNLEADLKEGKITIGDIYNILPILDRYGVIAFNLAIVELSGEQIEDILEAGVSYGLEKGEGIIQVSGLKYTYDPARRKGNRILDITVNGGRLDLNKTYKVTVNGYLAMGGGAYRVIKGAKKRYDTGLMDFDVVVEYVKTHSPITAPPPEGRIVRVE